MSRRPDNHNEGGRVTVMKPCPHIEAMKSFEKHYRHITLNGGMVTVSDVKDFAESAKRAVEVLGKGLWGKPERKKTVPEQYEIAIGEKTVMNVTVPPGTIPVQLVNHLISLAAMVSVENGLPAEDAVDFLAGQFEDLILCRG